jgi:hypothetical protein
MKKRISATAGLLLALVIFLSPVFAADNKALQIKKQPEIQQIKPRKPVKIRLKRSAEGKYTWDLTGDDVDEVVRADKRLRRLLNLE